MFLFIPHVQDAAMYYPNAEGMAVIIMGLSFFAVIWHQTRFTTAIYISAIILTGIALYFM
jgi:hypothetical protein